MAKDTRIFRVTRTTGKVQYSTRTAVGGMFATVYRGYKRGRTVAKVEATNAEATEGWTDVTEEFRNPQRPPDLCKRHPGYTGKQRPRWRWEGDKLCTCWVLYGTHHPDYPQHSDLCDKPATDPANCDCKMLEKLLG
jgi:hypothetical protein